MVSRFYRIRALTQYKKARSYVIGLLLELSTQCVVILSFFWSPDHDRKVDEHSYLEYYFTIFIVGYH